MELLYRTEQDSPTLAWEPGGSPASLEAITIYSSHHKAHEALVKMAVRVDANYSAACPLSLLLLALAKQAYPAYANSYGS